jgi:ADP-ribosylglycohydrolase
MYGLAFGDAMGMPGQLWPRERIRRELGTIQDLLPGPPDHFLSAGLEAGTVTDDTQQALALARAIAEAKGELEPALVAHHILDWARRSDAAARGELGPSSQAALQAIEAGKPVAEAGSGGWTNGAAMRIAPVGIVRRSQDLPALVDAVALACQPTHNTGLAIGGAAAVAAAISAGLDGLELGAALERAVEAAGAGESRGHYFPGASPARRLRFALDLASHHSGEALAQELYELVGTGIATQEAVPAALAVAASARGNVLAAGRMAANLGGDGDTVAAIACAVCGAFDDWGWDEGGRRRKLLDGVNGLDLPGVAIELVRMRR